VDERLQVYNRVRAYRKNPTQFIRQWEQATTEALEDVIVARELLKETTLPDDALDVGLRLVQSLEIDSARAEYTMLEAARAHAAADGRTVASINDVRAVAPMALRQRRSEFMVHFFESQQQEDEQIRQSIDALTNH
jgi:magnesium chelatase subunit I